MKQNSSVCKNRNPLSFESKSEYSPNHNPNSGQNRGRQIHKSYTDTQRVFFLNATRFKI